MVWRSPQQFIEGKERDVEAGEVESRFWYKEGEGEMCVHVRGMKRFSCVSSHVSSSQLLLRYSDGAFICSGVCSAAKRDAHVSVG